MPHLCWDAAFGAIARRLGGLLFGMPRNRVKVMRETERFSMQDELDRLAVTVTVLEDQKRELSAKIRELRKRMAVLMSEDEDWCGHPSRGLPSIVVTNLDLDRTHRDW